VYQSYVYVDRHDHYTPGSERIADMLVFEATCAVEGCEDTFRTGRTEASLRRNPRMRRTCAAHKAQFRSPAPCIWGKRGGTTQKLVLKVLGDLSVVGALTEGQVCRAVAARLPRGTGRKDQRYQQAKRALHGLQASELVTPDLTPVPPKQRPKHGVKLVPLALGTVPMVG
jgi:hypothetical protein